MTALPNGSDDMISLKLSLPNSDDTFRFELRRVPDGVQMVDEYRTWLQECAHYRIESSTPGGLQQKFTYTVDPDHSPEADADIGFDEVLEGVEPAATRSWARYYAVDGVLLSVEGVKSAETPVVKALSDRTVHQLRELKTPRWQTAPGLAALSGAELAELLPDVGDFPGGWDTSITRDSQSFGVRSAGLSPNVHPPADCGLLLPSVLPSNYPGAGASSRDGPKMIGREPIYDLGLDIDREFDRTLFESTADRAERCQKIIGDGPQFTVTVAENGELKSGARRLRYRITWLNGDRDDAMRPTYVSLTRLDALVVSGEAVTGHEDDLDRLVDITTQRIEDH